ncbi:MAG TPA: UbiD family decarboxylase [Candidatus Sulfotelmatobacter sp.]|nr:UbiD family decarboxylase [Candidatus Sulfotelmatobacter sp.]
MSELPVAPFADLRSFLAHLEHTGRLRRVAKPVDKDWEIACLARWALESTPEQNAYALLFENVKDHSGSVAVNLFSTPEMYGAALGVGAGDLLETWAKALEQPRKPMEVAQGPVFDVVHTGAQVDARKLPAPVWTPGRDGGAYLSAASVITKDPETGIQNIGIYRMQIHDDKSIGLSFASKTQHGAMHYAKYAKRQQPMPVAAVIGAPPVVSFAAAAKTAYGVDEMDIAGGLAGSGIEVLHAKTVDLLVPAHAECVIEGFVAPHAERMEGPFGEVLGYLAEAFPAPVLNVSAICHRTAPIHHGYVQQMPPSDGHFVMEMGFLGPLWFYLTRKLKMKGLADLAIARGSASMGIVVAQIKKDYVKDSAAIGRALTKFNLGQKFIYLVDEDIEIRDQDSLNWALSSRVDPERDIEFIKDFPSFQYDPSTLARAAAEGKELGEPPYPCSIGIVNATVKCAVPEISVPGRTPMYEALKHWDQTGLPPVMPRKRLERLLKTHADVLPGKVPYSDTED